MIRNPLVLYRIFKIRPKTIIHIGAHQGQDGKNYKTFIQNSKNLSII
jgi:hypothetical protein